jgi:glutamate decarboxylase
LLNRGWQVPAFALIGEAKNISVMRVMIRQGVSRDMAALLLEDIRRAVEHFEKQPIAVPLTEREVPIHTHA